LDLIISCSLIIIIIMFRLCKVMSITKIPDILNITVMISFNFGFNLDNNGQIFFIILSSLAILLIVFGFDRTIPSLW
jgi:hypothetical protein